MRFMRRIDDISFEIQELFNRLWRLYNILCKLELAILKIVLVFTRFSVHIVTNQTLVSKYFCHDNSVFLVLPGRIRIYISYVCN